ncbi:MAG: hypothetical protein A3B38_02970 [Candidatus Levybacteria bacterium RIFCSPLOWO2_01_FULL_36_13]|nr:MAG: hypothetical protein A2684_04060 [Candidatus Levybacteria bacterium RIFCSPHIGHO2_01_FULL_36_15b]OGH35854.1 MAG: hypothetical protein A3B38_02970 [Candidatus Levybacteria bacterium RIFCSPLOWO2_01_FULL_36_13]
MKAVRQEHFSGCAVACVAFILKTNYRNALKSFDEGAERAKFRGFYCREIIQALERNGLKYFFKYVKRRKNHEYPTGTIIFIQKDSKHPAGHFLCNARSGWMDPWINFPKLSAKADFRKRLPGKPIYAILSI